MTARVLEPQGIGVRARTGTRDEASIDLYWLPLGAGGRSVRLNGRVFEAVMARVERRRPLDLYHSALEVCVPEGRFVIEMTPIPDAEGAARGVVGEGPVGSRRIARSSASFGTSCAAGGTASFRTPTRRSQVRST